MIGRVKPARAIPALKCIHVAHTLPRRARPSQKEILLRVSDRQQRSKKQGCQLASYTPKQFLTIAYRFFVR